MPRPKMYRWVRCNPVSDFFKPRGIPLSFLERISLSMDEFEAIRLADFEGFYQEEAAKKMGISRQTFGRILEEAHRKFAECLVLGKAIKIEGGDYIMITSRFQCAECGYAWEMPHGSPEPPECPQCRNINIHRIEGDRSYSGGAGYDGGRGGYGRGAGPGRRGGQGRGGGPGRGSGQGRGGGGPGRGGGQGRRGGPGRGGGSGQRGRGPG